MTTYSHYNIWTSTIQLFFACVFMFVLSCGGGQGTLTVTTTPVPGMVSVDGKLCGESPVTLTLKAGTHEVSFSDYTDQYIIPQKRSIIVNDKEVKYIIGEYRNRFIPADPPAGFSTADFVRYYGTQERKLKDGTIFDYIDGGALVYLKHGLRETTHAVYRDREGSELVIDIFDMETPQNAETAFHDEEICPPGYELCGIGNGCRSYNYQPDFLLYFHKSRYFVFLSTTNDFLKDVLLAYAGTIAHTIP